MQHPSHDVQKLMTGICTAWHTIKKILCNIQIACFTVGETQNLAAFRRQKGNIECGIESLSSRGSFLWSIVVKT